MDYSKQIDRLSESTQPIMMAIVALFENEEMHELVPKRTEGNWLNKDNYLRHNKVGKQRGNGIYIQSFDGSVLEIETRSRKFFFGDGFYTDTVMDLLDHLKEEINR